MGRNVVSLGAAIVLMMGIFGGGASYAGEATDKKDGGQIRSAHPKFTLEAMPNFTITGYGATAKKFSGCGITDGTFEFDKFANNDELTRALLAHIDLSNGLESIRQSMRKFVEKSPKGYVREFKSAKLNPISYSFCSLGWLYRFLNGDSEAFMNFRINNGRLSVVTTYFDPGMYGQQYGAYINIEE